MNRRSLLGLLGLASVGGAATLLSDDLTSLVDSDMQSGSTTTPTPTPNAEDTTWNWGSELQSRLNQSSEYGDITYASTATTTTVETSGTLSEITIQPADTDGDLFRFTMDTEGTPRDFEELVTATLRLASDRSFTATLDDTSVALVGGEADIGSFAAATGVHPNREEVVLLRADQEERLADVAASFE